MKPFTQVPIPARMAHLEKDRRGYPIPTMVLRDETGRPHFQINEESVRQRLIRDDLCSICGKKLMRGRWFAGGPMSAFSERGLYIDPPMHEECVIYSMKVCPYLAAPNYGKEIGTKTLTGSQVEKEVILVDPTMIANRPPTFICVMAVGEDYFKAQGPFADPSLPPSMVRYVRHKYDKVRQMKLFRHGVELTDLDEIRQVFSDTMRELRTEYNEAGRSDMWELAFHTGKVT